MKKFLATAVIISAGLMALSGCSASTVASTPQEAISMEEYGLETVNYQLPDKRFVECFTSYLETQYATMSCELVTTPLGEYTQATETFNVRYLTSARNEAYVCLEDYFETKYSVISCVPAEAR